MSIEDMLDWWVGGNTRPVTVDPVASLAAFQRQLPRPWRTASRFSNRHIRSHFRKVRPVTEKR